MTPTRIRLVWGTPPVAGGRWRLGLVNLKRVPRSSRHDSARSRVAAHLWKDYAKHSLHLSVRGVLFASLAALALVYFAGAAVIHRRLEAQTPNNRVGYLDLALPHRWSRLERLRGESQIAHARDLLAAHRTSEGFALLRSGLARHPADFSARHDLARLHIRHRLTARAIALLTDGLAHGYPGRDYLATLFVLLENADNPEPRAAAVLRAFQCFEALPADFRSADDAAWLDQQLVLSLLDAGRASEALRWLEARLPETDPFRREVTVVHLLDTGRPAEALPLALLWASDRPNSHEALRLLARAHRQLGDHAALDATLDRLRAADPSRPEGLLYALVQNHLAGRPAATHRALDELIFRHGGEPALYLALAKISADAGFLPGLDRVETESRERGFSAHPALWARLHLALRAADWPAALAHIELLHSSPGPVLGEIQQHFLETMRRLALACAEGASGTLSSLVEIVAAHPGTLPLYRQIIEALVAADQPETARQILTLAAGPYPDSRILAELRPGIEAAVLAASPDAVHRALPTELASLEAFVAHLEIVGSAPAPVFAAFSALRRVAPDWMPSSAPQLEALELPFRARADDPLALQVLVRARLARDPEAPDTLLALARELDAENRSAHAFLLVQEILRRHPDHVSALAQLRTWTPTPAASVAKPAEPGSPQPARVTSGAKTSVAKT